MNSITRKASALLMAAAVTTVFMAAPAGAQGLNNNAWEPQPSNRASIAALMRQVEDGEQASSGFAALGTGGGVTQLICGSNSGDGAGASSNAQANSSCIILNNSDGTLNIDQNSDGEQNANTTSTATTTVDETINGGADAVLDVLAGN